MPRLTKEAKARNRARILDAAVARFRDRGFDDVGIDEVTKAAGLTHGAFYNHFPSKQALILAACSQSVAQVQAYEAEIFRSAPTSPLADIVDIYLSPTHRDRDTSIYPPSTLAVDAARQGEDVQQIFATGIESTLSRFATALVEPAVRDRPPNAAPSSEDQAAIVLIQLTGALLLARAVRKAQPGLSDYILNTARSDLARRLA